MLSEHDIMNGDIMTTTSKKVQTQGDDMIYPISI